jgi:hypothetical protein
VIALSRRWLAEIDETYVVSLVRMLLGVLLFLHAAREASELAEGIFFGDIFHIPVISESLVPSKTVFTGLVAAQLILAVVVVTGRAARWALLGSAAIGLYLLLCDRLGYHNNRYALFLFALLLAFAPCEDAFVLGRRTVGARVGPLWATRLAQVQIALIYLGSGGSKLFDPDWRGGLVIGDRLLKSTQIAIDKGVPEELMHWLADPAVASLLSKLAIASELSLAVALFVPRTRVLALWWGTMFHFTIEVTSKVELFGWLTVTIYALFATPKTRERQFLYDPNRALGRAMFRAVRWFDWLARFESHADAPRCEGHPFAVVDRDGTAAVGFRGVALLARVTPVLFPASVPLWVAAHLFTRPDTGQRTVVAESLPAGRSGSEDLPK